MWAAMHTDTENHPSVIHDEPVIRISRKTGLPIGPKLNKRALKRLAERQRRKELAEKRAAGLLEEEEDEEEDEEDDDMRYVGSDEAMIRSVFVCEQLPTVCVFELTLHSVAESVNLGEARKKNESKEEKKARKQAVKEMRRVWAMQVDADALPLTSRTGSQSTEEADKDALQERRAAAEASHGGRAAEQPERYQILTRCNLTNK